MLFWKLEECYEFLHNIKLRFIGFVFADHKEQIREEWENVSFQEDENWYWHESLVAHACGGNVRLNYTNSREALNQAIADGFQVIEVDLRLSSDSKLLCAHDFQRKEENMAYEEYINTPVDYRFTAMDFDTFYSLVKNKRIVIIADIKKDYEMERIIQFLREIVIDTKRFYIQIGKERQIYTACGFPVLYNLGSADDYHQAAAFCIKHDIRVVSLGIEKIKASNGWNVLCDHGIRVYVHTINRLDDFEELNENGIAGVFTDFLIPKDLELLRAS